MGKYKNSNVETPKEIIQLQGKSTKKLNDGTKSVDKS